MFEAKLWAAAPAEQGDATRVAASGLLASSALRLPVVISSRANKQKIPGYPRLRFFRVVQNAPKAPS